LIANPRPDTNQTIQKIKSKGFWEINIHPLTFNENRLSLSSCKQMVQESQVQFRGWDYPHINSQYGIVSCGDWVEDVTDWYDHVEYWRMFRSAQFFHLLGCLEDWWGDVRIYWSEKKVTAPGYGLEFLVTLYCFTEIYEFAARLAKKNIFDDALKISVRLNGMDGRRLVTTEIQRSMLDFFVCRVNKIELTRISTVEELIGTSKSMAIDDTISVFEHFNFFNPPREVLEAEQDKLIKRIF
jgi:hypothetical protein